MTATEPFHTAIVDGLPIRFYPSPKDGPDYLWVAFVDALFVARFPQEGHVEIMQRWRTMWPGMIHTLPDGTVIVPNVAIAGLFEWAAQLGWEHANDLLHAYDEQARLVFAVRHAHVPIDAFGVIAQQAALRDMLVVPGVQRAN